MLLEFSVTNFTSFKDTARLSMVSSQRTELKDEHTIPLYTSKKSKIYANRLAALFGANASGKSNLFLAFNFMVNILLKAGFSLYDSKELKNKKITRLYKPFAFNTKTKQQPTSFESVFSIDKTIYRYGFSYNEKSFVEEWLFSKTTTQVEEQQVFIRHKNELGKSGDTDLDVYVKHISDTNLFLTILAELKVAKYLKLFKFFTSIGFAKKHTFDLEGLSDLVQKEDARTLSCLLKFADTGISGLTAEQLKQEQFQEKVGDILNKAKAPSDDVKNFLRALERATKTAKIFECNFHHDIYNDGEKSEYHLSPEDESTGTLRYIAIISYMLDALRNNKILLIDELDTSLHPLLVEGLIDFFVKVKSRGQLIFSSHCPFMFDQKKIRRDELWLVDKNNQGTSRLESAVEYKEAARGDGNLAKRYLEGKFGGIPYIQHHILSECVNVINASITENQVNVD